MIRLIESATLWIDFSENFPKNFLNFRFDTVEKQSILNLSNYKSKGYASVVLGDSEVTFLREGRMQPFVHLYFILFISGTAKLKK